MDMKKQKAVISVFGFLSLLLFASMALAATVDTKTPSKMTSAPASVMKAPTVSAPVATVTPQVKIKAPIKSIKPKSSVPVPSRNTTSTSPRPADISRPSSPTRTVTPKVKIQTQPRLQIGDAVKVLPPPNPPTRPQVQPKVNIEKTVHQLPPMPDAIIRQPGSTAKYPEIPDPPNRPRTVPGIDSAHTPPGMAAKPDLNPQAPGAYNPAGIYIPGIAPGVTVNPAIENSEFNNPRMRQMKDRQDVLDNVRAAERAKAIGDAWNEFGQIGGQGRDRKEMGEIFGEYQPGSGGDTDYMEGPPVAGGWGTSKDKGGFVRTRHHGDGGRGRGNYSFSGTYKHDDGSTSVITDTVSPGSGGGSRIREVQVITSDGNGVITYYGYRKSKITSNGEVVLERETNGTEEGEANAEEAYDAAAEEVPQNEGEDEPEGTGGEEGTGDDEQATNPNDFAGGKGACADSGGFDVRTGKCRDSPKSVKQRTDEMTGQRSRADGGEGTSLPTIGPDAVTDYEHGNRGGGGGGFNPIDMKDPPKGVPGGASLDNAMDALD